MNILEISKSSSAKTEFFVFFPVFFRRFFGFFNTDVGVGFGFSFRVNWNRQCFDQFVCDVTDVVKDTGKEEYLRPFIRIGLDS